MWGFQVPQTSLLQCGTTLESHPLAEFSVGSAEASDVTDLSPNHAFLTSPQALLQQHSPVHLLPQTSTSQSVSRKTNPGLGTGSSLWKQLYQRAREGDQRRNTKAPSMVRQCNRWVVNGAGGWLKGMHWKVLLFQAFGKDGGSVIIRTTELDGCC